MPTNDGIISTNALLLGILGILAIILLYSWLQGPTIASVDGIIEKFATEKPVVIEVKSESCPICIEMKPIIGEFRDKHPEVNLRILDREDNNIRVTVPLFIIVRTDGSYESHLGGVPYAQLEDWVQMNYR